MHLCLMLLRHGHTARSYSGYYHDCIIIIIVDIKDFNFRWVLISLISMIIINITIVIFNNKLYMITKYARKQYNGIFHNFIIHLYQLPTIPTYYYNKYIPICLFTTLIHFYYIVHRMTMETRRVVMYYEFTIIIVLSYYYCTNYCTRGIKNQKQNFLFLIKQFQNYIEPFCSNIK